MPTGSFGSPAPPTAPSSLVDPRGAIGWARVPHEHFGWPLRPFRHPHVIRATFGEPRGILDLGLSGVKLSGAVRMRYRNHANKIAPLGRRVIHTGIDIVARDGTAVYAVQSGVALRRGQGYETHLSIGDFEYWHLQGAVPSGTKVTAFRTVIGRVYPGQHHLHLTRLTRAGDQAMNPLVQGGITPYRDSAPPRIGALIAFDATGARVPLWALKGPVVLATNTYDVQSLGRTHTGVFRLGYTLFPRRSRRPVVGPVPVVEFDALPAPGVGDVLYTPSSTRHAFATRFWIRLTDRSPSADGFLHTEDLSPGLYRLVVQAADAKGNRAKKTFTLRVRR